jgi:hypothetical protein
MLTKEEVGGWTQSLEQSSGQPDAQLVKHRLKQADIPGNQKTGLPYMQLPEVRTAAKIQEEFTCLNYAWTRREISELNQIYNQSVFPGSLWTNPNS